MDTLKNQIFDSFLNIISQNENMPEHEQRALAYALMEAAMGFIELGINSFTKMHLEAVTDLEQHKKMFRDHIELIDKYTKAMLTSFKRQGFVKPDLDDNRRPILKGRTKMVDDMVVFLNALNDSVLAFYKDVYRMEDLIKEPQISLF